MNNTIKIVLPFVDNLGEKSLNNLLQLISDSFIGIEEVTNYEFTDLEVYINTPLVDSTTTILYVQKAKKIIKHIIKERTKEWLDKEEFNEGLHPTNYCTVLKCLCGEMRDYYDYK